MLPKHNLQFKLSPPFSSGKRLEREQLHAHIDVAKGREIRFNENNLELVLFRLLALKSFLFR